MSFHVNYITYARQEQLPLTLLQDVQKPSHPLPLQPCGNGLHAIKVSADGVGKLPGLEGVGSSACGCYTGDCDSQLSQIALDQGSAGAMAIQVTYAEKNIHIS